MSRCTDASLAELLEAQRTDAGQRPQSLGPIVEAVGLLRASAEVIRTLLDELDSRVGVHLELLDMALRHQLGNRWWECLHKREEGRHG